MPHDLGRSRYDRLSYQPQAPTASQAPLKEEEAGLHGAPPVPGENLPKITALLGQLS